MWAFLIIKVRWMKKWADIAVGVGWTWLLPISSSNSSSLSIRFLNSQGRHWKGRWWPLGNWEIDHRRGYKKRLIVWMGVGLKISQCHKASNSKSTTLKSITLTVLSLYENLRSTIMTPFNRFIPVENWMFQTAKFKSSTNPFHPCFQKIRCLFFHKETWKG